MNINLIDKIRAPLVNKINSNFSIDVGGDIALKILASLQFIKNEFKYKVMHQIDDEDE